MLKQLYISNFALIDELTVNFHTGFSVITGETGAGKSVIIGAISLLLGQRAESRNLLPNDKKKCVIEAHFDISLFHIQSLFTDNDLDFDPHDCILRREISTSGKSRAFINDTPISLSLMKELGDQLIDIHSQHQNLLLGKEDFQLHVVDTVADNNTLLQEYDRLYQAYTDAATSLKLLKVNIEAAQREEDFLRFQVQELDDLHLREGEQAKLEADSETMGHAEEIKTALYESFNIFDNDESGILTQLKRVADSLRQIEDVYRPVTEIAQRVESNYVEAKDIMQEISAHIEGVDFDPKQLELINERLDHIYTMEQKYRVSSETELLSLLANLHVKLGDIEHGDEEIENQEQQVSQLKSQCQARADRLTNTRKQAAAKIEKEMVSRLKLLGIPNIRFKIMFETKTLGSDGADGVSFWFSANKNVALQPVSKIASGGETARVMLTVKALIAETAAMPTVIFDEIDTGVSGRVAEEMGRVMQDMGNHGRQVVCITHLPQIAARGNHHYKVVKQDDSDTTRITMIELNQQQRIQEIAQLLSGSDISSAAVDNAKSLLASSQISN